MLSHTQIPQPVHASYDNNPYFFHKAAPGCPACCHSPHWAKCTIHMQWAISICCHSDFLLLVPHICSLPHFLQDIAISYPAFWWWEMKRGISVLLLRQSSSYRLNQGRPNVSWQEATTSVVVRFAYRTRQKSTISGIHHWLDYCVIAIENLE
jgi:hypothetical protein